MWYYVENGQQRGPITEADLQGLLRVGKISEATLVWREGMAEWLPYSQAVAGTATSGSTGDAAPNEVVCAECGKIFPASEVIRYGNSAVCAGCKPIFVQKLKEGVNVGAAMDLAGWWTRFAAYFLDGIITAIVGGVLGGIIGAVVGAAGAARDSGGIIAIQVAAGGVGFLIRVIYFTYFIGKFGQTPGKMLCKIKVVNADGSQVSYAKALGRFFGYFVSGIICAIGFLMAAWDDEKRALHDRMCNTRVVKV